MSRWVAVHCKFYCNLKAAGAETDTPNSNFEKIPELVKSGKLDLSVVDTAVSRLLRAKFEMGLFENPYPAAPEGQWDKLIHSPEAVKLARELDKESIVLLENHDDVLPLKKSGDIAVIGPMAHGFMNVCKNLCSVLTVSLDFNKAFSTVTTLSTRVSIGV